MTNSDSLSLEGPKVGQSAFATQTYNSFDEEADECSSPDMTSKGNKLPVGAMTDPNSIYRKLYNRNLDFFVWVIEQE